MAYIIFTQKSLDAEVGFTALQLLYILNNYLNFIPMVYTSFLTTKISFNRIANFLNEGNVSNIARSGGSDETQSFGAGFKDAELKYHGQGEDNSVFTLRNLSVTFPTGKLSVIAGSTGSGKSSLLLGLLGGINNLI
jgi:ABC-type multidrug transport system fused ATPase/permease subunit